MQGRGMTTFYVPEIGDRFTLSADWSFTLYGEYRNRALIDILGLRADKERKAAEEEAKRLYAVAFQPVVTQIPYSSFGKTVMHPHTTYRAVDLEAQKQHQALQCKLNAWPYQARLPAGTELQIDRIYIRKGAKDFSSITFYIAQSPLPILSGTKKSNRRFWAKLRDCNQMQIDREEAPQLALAS